MLSPRLLIVGAGKLGLPLARRCARDMPVLLLSRRPPEAEHNLIPFPADVTALDSLGSLPASIEVVVYCLSPTGHNYEAYRQVFVEGLANLLQALKHSALRRVIFVSSTSVYHQDDDSWVDETSPTCPSGFSGKRLLEAEQLLQASGVPATSVRFAGIYGGDRTRFLEQILAGEIAVTGGPYTNRIHEQDCIGVLEHLVHKALAGEALADCYLGCDSEPARVGEIAAWVQEQVGSLPNQPRAGSGTRRAGSKRCSNRLLLDSGYRFRYPSFREGYGEMLARRGDLLAGAGRDRC